MFAPVLRRNGLVNVVKSADGIPTQGVNNKTGRPTRADSKMVQRSCEAVFRREPQHTVKPWFQGKTDFSPPVPDLTNDGFILVGGRFEVIHQQAAAAIVYKRRQHIISLYVSPSPGGGIRPTVQDLGGYHLLHWRHDNMSYWAVSEVASADLRDFSSLIDQAGGNSR